MFRKLSLVAVAAASLAAAALAPTSASALAPRRLGRSPLLRRWPGVLWLWRLLCAAPGPDAVGAPVASGQSLLLSNHSIPEVKGPGPVVPGLFAFHKREQRRCSCNFY